MKLIKNLLLIAILSVYMCGCSKDDPTSQPVNTVNSMLSQDEWLTFEGTEYGGYMSYTFDGNGNGHLEKFDKNGEVYGSEDFSYTCTDNQLTMRGHEYSIIESDKEYLITEGLYGQTIFFRFSSPGNQYKKLEGIWEKYSNDWYKMYELHADGTYRYEQILNFAYDDEESGDGTYELNKAMITFKPNNKILPAYSFLYHIDENGDLILGYYYNGDPNKYKRLSNESESLRPKLTKESEYFPQLTSGSWYRYDRLYNSSGIYKYGIEFLCFGDDEQASLKKYYCDFNSEASSGGRFWINENKIGSYDFTCNDITIESLSDTELHIKKKFYGDLVYHKYKTGEFERMLIGTWICDELILTFEDNGDFNFIVYDGNQIEKQSPGTYTFENGILKWNFVTPVWYVTGGVIEFIDNNNFKLYSDKFDSYIPFQRM